MKKHEMIIIIVTSGILLFGGVFGVRYTFWSQSFTSVSIPSGNNSINIGSGKEITIKLSLKELRDNANGKKLVPHTLNNIDVENEVLSYVFAGNVNWDVVIIAGNEKENMESVIGVLTVTIDSILNHEDENFNHIIQANALPEVMPIKIGEKVHFQIEVFMHEPASLEEY